MPAIVINSSVGFGGTNNSNDAIVVKTRLIALGFTWLQPDSSVGPETVRAIKLFQAIKNGYDTLFHANNDGLIEPGENTLDWLQAANAPRWQRMSRGSAAEGFINDEVVDTSDNHDFGTSWLDEALRLAGASYKANYLTTHPNASLLRINDTSKPTGGITPHHGGHQTGLVCDVRLPRTNGTAGGITVSSPSYDRNAMREILRAFRRQALHDRILLNDNTLISEGLCRWASNHDDHAHFEIKPPARIPDAA